MLKEHGKGFEKEEKFHKALGIAHAAHPTFRSATLEAIISSVAPEFMKGLFERRPCVRKLKYRGCHWCSEAYEIEKPGYFIVGEVYESETYNGATYTIKGYEKKIGSTYFERLT